jgi:hypothetical protein
MRNGKKEWIAREAVSKQMSELSECTFAPTINVRSRRIGVSRRYRSTVRERGLEPPWPHSFVFSVMISQSPQSPVSRTSDKWNPHGESALC